MIVIRLSFGLANQMFQYALYLSFKNKGHDVYLDSSSFRPKWDFEIVSLENIFPNVKIKHVKKTFFKNKKMPLDFTFFSRLKRLIHKKFNYKEKYHKSYILENNMVYNPKIFECSEDTYLDGFWQSEKYFLDIKNIVKFNFKFRKFDSPKNIKYSNILSNTNSISVHVRKGNDYNKKIVDGTCDINYYINSINFIKSKVNNPKFFIFSDNIDWAKKNLSFCNPEYIDWNPISGDYNYLDMQLMSLCKHNIIANSSYSWWGAWLNSNKEKIVIAPKIWFSAEKSKLDYSSIVPENWIKF